MARRNDGSPNTPDRVGTDGHAEVERFHDPGLPPHRPRLADKDPRAAKRAEKQVAILFLISIVGTILFFVGYFAIEIDEPGSSDLRLQNLLLGLGTAFAMFGIGIGIVHWAKTLMPDHEVVESRKPVTKESERAEAEQILGDIIEETGIKRRPLIRNTMLVAMILAPFPAIAIFRDLGPLPGDVLRHTMWDEGVRLTLDPTGTPIRASDVTIGSAVHVIPEGLNEAEHKLEEKAKAVVLLMRLNPEDLSPSEGREDWGYEGIVAYSKICTHVGCPVALYEQQTHHLLCPCHQSTFDLTQECKVIFGPAVRPLPQLPITVDAEGYLVAQSDFTEPVGPSFWERG
ncbi:cytochrome bc1 complex Rieske iron-sulfur subunit [Arthrobacter sp. H14]|uniref:cytochrome bc1 complex Rieske iron-sulfur subunit n=1 Tax=Arthrobacter sp. H14 TaxID=1312959 RepID=UPI00047BE2F6|nr:Rieske 2Fe-2S domain-containing protein [Arthrobacter sp. H14]